MNKDNFFFITLKTNFVFYHLYVKTKLAAPVKRSDSVAITSFFVVSLVRLRILGPIREGGCTFI